MPSAPPSRMSAWLASQPLEERRHHARLQHVHVVLGEPHVDVPEQRLGPLEPADGGERAVEVRRVGVLLRARPAAGGQPGELLVLRGQQLGEHVAEDMVGQGRVVGQRRHVEAGAAHRVVGQGGIAVAVGEQGVVVQVGVHERGARGDPRQPRRPHRGCGAGDGDRPRVARRESRDQQAGAGGLHGTTPREREGRSGRMGVVVAHTESTGDWPRGHCPAGEPSMSIQ